MRLSRPQKELLAEIRSKGWLYIRRYERYGRTAEALRQRGLVKITEHDYSTYGQDRYEPT